MYVCLCKGITDRHIRDAVIDGAASLADLRRQLGVSSQCGQCACTARSIIQETRCDMASFSQQASFYAA